MLYENTCSSELLAVLRKLQAEELFKDYLLVGGTSLSLQMGHRKSVDIDLFTNVKQDNKEILEFIKRNFKTVEELNDKENILQVKADGVKIDFVKAKGKLFKEPIYENGLALCSKEDIAGMKLGIISNGGRCVPKDYIDIAYLIEDLTLKKMFEIYQWKYDVENIHYVKQQLASVDKVNPYEWQGVEMVSKKIYISEVPRVIRDAVENYNKNEVYRKRKIFGFFKKH